jgi:hypothetical protein
MKRAGIFNPDSPEPNPMVTRLAGLLFLMERRQEGALSSLTNNSWKLRQIFLELDRIKGKDSNQSFK